jgi:hypothetical protein
MIENKRIAFFHGLGLTPPRERASDVKGMKRLLGNNLYFPFIDYDLEWYRDRCRSMFLTQARACGDVDVLVGLSLGGYTAFLLANYLNKPAVLINPSIDRVFTKLDIKTYNVPVTFINPGIELFLGEYDDLIPMEITTAYLDKHNFDYDSYIVKGMGHNLRYNEFLEIIQKSKYLNR